jgi:O-antigen/teichoic acid export membrane protein
MNFPRSVLLTLGSKGVSVACALAASILTARYLGVEGRGIFGVLVTYYTLGLMIGTLGQHTANTYFAARSPELLTRITGNATIFGAAQGILTALVLFILYLLFPGILPNITTDLVLLTIAIVPFLLLGLLYQGIFLGLEHFKSYNAYDVVFRALSLIFLVVVLFFFTFDVAEVVASTLFASIATVGILWIGLRRVGAGFPVIDVPLYWQSTIYGATPFFVGILTFFLIRSNVILSNILSGEADAAYFSVAVQFTDFLYLLPMTIGAMLFPRVTKEAADGARYTCRVMRFTVLLLVSTSLIVGILAYPTVVFLFGEEFRIAATVLIILLPALVLYGLTNVIWHYFAGIGYPPFSRWIWIPGVILNCAAAVILIPVFGAIGAAWASTFGLTLVFLFHLHFFKKVSGQTLSAMFIVTAQDIIDVKKGILGIQDKS